MKCKDQRRALSAWLDGELSSDEISSLEAHLDNCADCRAYTDKLRRLNADVASMPSVRPDPNLSRRAKNVIAEERAREVAQLSVWTKVPVTALILITALGLGSLAGKPVSEILLDEPARSQSAMIMPGDSPPSLADVMSDVGAGEPNQ